MIYTYIVLQIALFLLSLGGYFQVKNFLSSHHEISNHTHLNNFKGMVRLNMYFALVYMAIGIPAILVAIYIGYTYGLLGIAGVLITTTPQMLFGKHLRSLEEKARQLRCSSDLNPEFAMVGEAWFKKALPNF